MKTPFQLNGYRYEPVGQAVINGKQGLLWERREKKPQGFLFAGRQHVAANATKITIAKSFGDQHG